MVTASQPFGVQQMRQPICAVFELAVTHRLARAGHDERGTIGVSFEAISGVHRVSPTPTQQAYVDWPAWQRAKSKPTRTSGLWQYVLETELLLWVGYRWLTARTRCPEAADRDRDGAKLTISSDVPGQALPSVKVGYRKSPRRSVHIVHRGRRIDPCRRRVSALSERSPRPGA